MLGEFPGSGPLAPTSPPVDETKAPTSSQELVSYRELAALGATDNELFFRGFFPKTFRQPSPAFAKEMSRDLDDPRVRFLNIRAFRGSAKTTRLRAFTAKRISYNISRTILYIGASEDHAKRSIAWLRGQVERNAAWAGTFGLRPGKKWSETEIEIIHGVEDAPIWMLGVGVTGNIRGINFDDYRPDLIICDDVITDENAATHEQREKISILLMGAVANSLTPTSEEPNAKMVVCQTPLHQEDASSQMFKDPRWLSRWYPCWTPETLHSPIDQQVSIWPERYPSSELRKEKEAAIAINRLSVFIREMECRLVAAETSAFKPAWLRTWTEPPGHMHCVVSIDPVPPPSAREVSKGLLGKDYEAHAVIGRKNGEYYILDYVLNRGHEPAWTVAKALELAWNWRAARIVVEAVAYQKVLVGMLEAEMRRKGVYFAIVPLIDKRSKYNRITAELTGVAAQRKLIIGPHMVDFVQQFSEYPNVSHDDLLDAVANGMHDIVAPSLELGEADYLDMGGGYDGALRPGGCP